MENNLKTMMKKNISPHLGEGRGGRFQVSWS